MDPGILYVLNASPFYDSEGNRGWQPVSQHDRAAAPEPWGSAWTSVGVPASHGGLVAFRVLVLYLGNLYSLIIALLDKVNSMSTEVSTPARALPSARTRAGTQVCTQQGHRPCRDYCLYVHSCSMLETRLPDGLLKVRRDK